MKEQKLELQQIIDYLKQLQVELESDQVKRYFFKKTKEVRQKYIDHVFYIEILVEKLTLERLKEIQVEINEKTPELLKIGQELDSEIERLESARKVLSRLDKVVKIASRFALLIL